MTTNPEETPKEMVASFFSESSGALSSVPSNFVEEEAEASINNYQPLDSNDPTKRVLSSFLQFLPTNGKRVLAEAITTFNNETLRALSSHLVTSILVPMKARAPTPAVTPSPFDDNDDAVEAVAQVMDCPANRNSQEWLKKRCLRRDGYHCMVTNIYDNRAAAHLIPSSAHTAPTELSHIIPLSIGSWEDNKTDHKVAQIWATLGKCFPSINMKPTEVNDDYNLMTLVSLAHSDFGNFTLAFEPTGAPNEYKILRFEKQSTFLNSALPNPNAQGDRIVTFRKHADDVDLPSPVLLETHAALAKILHASGMAEYIEKILDEREGIRCLSSDGTTDIGRLLFAF
ncbi:hypothetical protein DTO207G8_6893 [Paecilomyces variotii]|nr:hypothetical protein DTO207G8_6893 [Paecilomyces variotii]KAJ9265507.1 hypothetical protein DTO212C5_6700 [Paecilomyces variotii]KAJ9383509.1 hypothetical protein DTO063F5_5166 [Paecilomyces variotii]